MSQFVERMIRKYHNHKLKTNPWHREGEPHNNHETLGRQTNKSNQLSLSRSRPINMISKIEWAQSNAQQIVEQLQNPTMVVMIAKLEWTQSTAQQNIEQLHNPRTGVTIINESFTNKPPP